MSNTRISVYERLESLLLGDQGERIRDADRAMRSNGQCEISIILTSKSSRLIDVGPLITNADRELRRAVTILGSDSEDRSDSYYFGGSQRNQLRPIPASQGGLQVEDASTGSMQLLVRAYGVVLALLTSRPLAALTTLLTLGQGIGSMNLWSRHKDPLNGMSAKQLLQAFKELGGDPSPLMRGNTASIEIKMQPARGESLLAQPDAEPIELIGLGHITGEMISVEGMILKGRLITYIRNYADGTQYMIRVERASC